MYGLYEKEYCGGAFGTIVIEYKIIGYYSTKEKANHARYLLQAKYLNERMENLKFEPDGYESNSYLRDKVERTALELERLKNEIFNLYKVEEIKVIE